MPRGRRRHAATGAAAKPALAIGENIGLHADVTFSAMQPFVAGSNGDKLCWFFAHGRCTKGAACSFVHEAEADAGATPAESPQGSREPAAPGAQPRDSGASAPRSRQQACAEPPGGQPPAAPEGQPGDPQEWVRRAAAQELALAAQRHWQTAAALWGLAKAAQETMPDIPAVPAGGITPTPPLGSRGGAVRQGGPPPGAPAAPPPPGAGGTLRLELAALLGAAGGGRASEALAPGPRRSPGGLPAAAPAAPPPLPSSAGAGRGSPGGSPGASPRASPRAPPLAAAVLKLAGTLRGDDASTPSTGGPCSVAGCSAQSDAGSHDEGSDGEVQSLLVVKNTFLVIQPESPKRALRSVKTEPGELCMLHQS